MHGFIGEEYLLSFYFQKMNKVIPFWPLLGTEPNFVFWLSGRIDPLSDDEGGGVTG